MEGGVEAAAGEEGLVGALLGDPALMHDDDQIRLADGGEAVGDDEGGPPVEKAAQGLLNQGLGLGVNAAGRLIGAGAGFRRRSVTRRARARWGNAMVTRIGGVVRAAVTSGVGF